MWRLFYGRVILFNIRAILIDLGYIESVVELTEMTNECNFINSRELCKCIINSLEKKSFRI